MLIELHIEALLVDENLADQVWELWDAGVITDGVAAVQFVTNPEPDFVGREPDELPYDD